MPLTIDKASVAHTLKQETSLHHLQAEELLIKNLNDIHSAEQYISLLKMFYGFYKPVEDGAHLFITPSVLPDINERKKSPWLKEDLSKLNAFDHLVLCDQLPKMESTEQALGCLYVLEGSTLGGRVILKMLQQHTVLSKHGDVFHFFNGYGNATGNKWLNFQQAINSFEGEDDSIIRSANETFILFHNWIKQVL